MACESRPINVSKSKALRGWPPGKLVLETLRKLFLRGSSGSEVSKRGWREGVGDKQPPKAAQESLQ